MLTTERGAMVAGELERLADGIGTALAEVDAYDRSDVWTGAKASAFRAEAVIHAMALALAADRLRAAAARIRRLSTTPG